MESDSMRFQLDRCQVLVNIFQVKDVGGHGSKEDLNDC
jgi:hypothetical protein